MTLAGSLAMPHRAPSFRPVERTPPIPNAVVAIVVLVTGEAMLFAGLIGTYLIFRISAPDWPPRDLPRLPIPVTVANTLVLLASLAPITRALRRLRRGEGAGLARLLGTSAAIGVLFVAVQGAEWARLIHHGLTAGSSLYGATFYLIIGCHAVHVVAAVVWLLVLAALAWLGRVTPERRAGLEMATVYWYFVCVLWVALFGVVYL
ncbi:MAG TPA: cytochrome c oxidase subunit 3 [Candidatus Binatia bacterium]|nr:cytochrome c oxidase subunit 3 [Candidatus Binatia bacterium]